jgi:hypothetical protein
MAAETCCACASTAAALHCCQLIISSHVGLTAGEGYFNHEMPPWILGSKHMHLGQAYQPLYASTRHQNGQQ